MQDSYQRRRALQRIGALLTLAEREATARRVVEEHVSRHPAGPSADAIWCASRPRRRGFADGSNSWLATAVRETQRERRRIRRARREAVGALDGRSDPRATGTHGTGDEGSSMTTTEPSDLGLEHEWDGEPNGNLCEGCGHADNGDYPRVWGVAPTYRPHLCERCYEESKETPGGSDED